MTHPHQTPVRELYVSPDAATALQAEAEKLPAWMLDARQKGELALLMNGALAPLRGYMSEAEYSAVPDGAWPVPLVLQVSADFSGRVQPGDDIALRDGGGVVAVMSVTDAWGDPVLLGGKVKGLRFRTLAKLCAVLECVPGDLLDYHYDPDDLQAVEGVGELRARSVREGLSRLAESTILERYV